MKKIICLICVIVLTLTSTSLISAATWSSSFVSYASGNLTVNTPKKWSASIKSIGWDGCWCGQVYQGRDITKGKKYRIKFNINSSKLDKYVYLKIGNGTGTKMNLGMWLDCKKGKIVNVDKTFTAKYNGSSIQFGLGGDTGSSSGGDAKVRYYYAPNRQLDGRLDSIFFSGHPTVISCENFSFSEVKPRFSSKKMDEGILIIKKGKVAILKISGVKGKIKWSAKKKKLVKLTKVGKYKVLVKGKKRGNTTIIAKVKKKKYKVKAVVY